jgi:hypothetical protein
MENPASLAGFSSSTPNLGDLGAGVSTPNLGDMIAG